LQTPSQRKRVSKLDHYDSITHVETGVTYDIGDGILISANAVKDCSLNSPMLVPEKPLSPSPRKRASASPAKSSPSKGKKKDVVDGLEHYALLGILIDLWKDETDKPMMKVHWLYRPRVAMSVWEEWETADIKFLKVRFRPV
jgi:hypothetical protein